MRVALCDEGGIGEIRQEEVIGAWGKTDAGWPGQRSVTSLPLGGRSKAVSGQPAPVTKTRVEPLSLAAISKRPAASVRAIPKNAIARNWSAHSGALAW